MDHYTQKAVDRFAGLDPHALVTLMLQHAAAGREAERLWEETRDWQHRARAKDAFTLESAARLRLAIDFGAARGWTLAKSGFGLRTLGTGKTHAGSRYTSLGEDADPYAGNFHDECDHAYYFRRNRKAAAIAAHLYNFPGNRAQCEALATRFGLTLETPDFPSWWNPGGTRLVLYIGPAGLYGAERPKVRHS
jgi:hypothetical protein